MHNLFENSDLDAVDVLDTETNTWTSAEKLPRSRESPGCMVYEHKGDMGILVAGGCDNDCLDHLADTLFYSFSTEKWTVLGAKLNTPRMGMKMVDVGGKPTLIGGYYDRILDTIEEFDGENWVLRDQALSMKRYAYGMPGYMPASDMSCSD